MPNFVSNNRFAALDSDAEDSAPAPAVTTEAKQPKQLGVQPQPERSRRPQPTRDQQQTGPRRRNEDQPLVSAAAAAPGEDATGDDENRRRGGPPGGRRGGRGGARGGAPGMGARGREFDRHSGTGRGREMKKGGAGGHNWGNIDREEGAAASGTELEQPSGSRERAAGGSEEPESPVSGTAPAAAAPPPPPPEEQVRDYAEYQRELRQKRATVVGVTDGTSSSRKVDAKDLEKEGYQRYAREETEEDRRNRRNAGAGGESEECSDDDNNGGGGAAGNARNKGFSLLEFGGKSRRGGDRRGDRDRRGRPGDRDDDRARGFNGHHASAQLPQPVLSDERAFPTLG